MLSESFQRQGLFLHRHIDRNGSYDAPSTGFGLGTCWVGYFDPKLISKEFDIPEGIEIKHLLPIGYPATDSVPGPMHSKRKSLEELVVEL
ncbi:nitroreductase family protein [Candidatus Methanarcanum hacksteinii]|uniref:nitroreductase family protein n=1 Tax=Candidatus Methanarcanum hacksteinii TaxID=2911857 RepID=UPI0037DCF341